MLEYEENLYKDGITLIAGVDEVGRGPLIGPVVACACILPINFIIKILKIVKNYLKRKEKKCIS